MSRLGVVSAPAAVSVTAAPAGRGAGLVPPGTPPSAPGGRAPAVPPAPLAAGSGASPPGGIPGGGPAARRVLDADGPIARNDDRGQRANGDFERAGGAAPDRPVGGLEVGGGRDDVGHAIDPGTGHVAASDAEEGAIRAGVDRRDRQ